MLEGVIKYNNSWVRKPLGHHDTYQTLESTRRALNRLGLVGCYPNGIGYGNISLKNTHRAIIITASQTGHLRSLAPCDYAQVLAFDVNTLFLRSKGKRKASSEALTHCAIYDSKPSVRAVIHIHSPKLWRFMLGHGFPKTPHDVTYGTQEMAYAVAKLLHGMRASGIFVTEGHEDGVFCYAPTLKQAARILNRVYRSA